MNAIEAKAWECGICHKLYKYNDQFKQYADACCVCCNKNCNNGVDYTGSAGTILCKICKLKEDIPKMKQWIETRQRDYEYAIKELQDIENRGK